MSVSEPNPQWEALLAYIKQARGFDFTGYKRTSLMRRFTKRMQEVGVESFGEYLDYLEVHPGEFIELFNRILINVTGFFRDRDLWDYLARVIIPRILEDSRDREMIRVWSAGCASGEEAYTLAIEFAEALGEEAFQERVKIYATDLDEESLERARQGIYNPREVAALDADILDRYFERSENGYTFRKDLRRNLIFGRHNLLQDAPISRLDLLVCRNTLMYFNAEAQEKIIDRFHFALNENGFLFLGKAEMLPSPENPFIPVNLKRRVFTRTPESNPRDRFLPKGDRPEEEDPRYPGRHVRLRSAALDAGPVAGIVVDREGLLVFVNERARELFGLGERDLDRPLQDLELSYRPVELRSRLDRLYNERRAVIVQNVEWNPNSGETLFFDALLFPLFDRDGSLLGATITFSDVTRTKRLQQELEQSNQALEMAYEELQSTNEELETTNEELQSTNEELETMNEELQSTNEELETTNEELQSTNEELETTNEELHARTEELNSVNTLLWSILTSMRAGVVVIDRDLRVLVWNDRAEELWGIRAEEARGQYLLNLDIGLPVERLLPELRSRFAAGTFEAIEMSLEAINRRGRSIECRVTANPLLDAFGTLQGAILFMEERG